MSVVPRPAAESLPAPFSLQVVGAAARPDGPTQLPSPPPGLLAAAQDSLSSVLTLSQMSLEPSPSVPPSGPVSLPAQLPGGPRSPDSPPREPAPPPPRPAGPPSLPSHTLSEPLYAVPAAPARPRAPSPPPPVLPPRGLPPSVRNIPTIPCSTGAVPVPGAAG